MYFIGFSRNEAANRLNNSVLEDKGVYKYILVQIRRLLKWLKKVHLEEHILESFILVLMESSTESHGKLFLSVKISYYVYIFGVAVLKYIF